MLSPYLEECKKSSKSELKMPILLITGAHDTVVPAWNHSERLERLLSQVQLVSPETGHAHHARIDQVVALIKDFVDERKCKDEYKFKSRLNSIKNPTVAKMRPLCPQTEALALNWNLGRAKNPAEAGYPHPGASGDDHHFEQHDRIRRRPPQELFPRARPNCSAKEKVIARGERLTSTPPNTSAKQLLAAMRAEARCLKTESRNSARPSVLDEKENGLSYRPSRPWWYRRQGGLCYDFMASLEEGDEVIIRALLGRLSRHGAAWWQHAVIVDTDAEAGFVLRPDALAAAITPKTKWLLLDQSGNPSGCLMDREQIEALAEVLRANPHVWVMTDDIYEHVLYDDNAFHSIGAIAPDLQDRSLVINGLSKAYA